MKKTRCILLCIIIMSLFGCATVENPDPLEKFNRGVYVFNKTIDRFIIKPVAKGYSAVLPDPVEHSVSNFYSNLSEVPTIANNLLQLKFTRAIHSTGRLLINSTVGLLGLFDVATVAGIEHHYEDFGQTMGHYGYKRSAYLVLPFLGPSTIRDTIALPFTYYMSVYPYIEPDSDRIYLLTGKAISRRAELLKREEILKTVAVDEYLAERNIYLQHREFLINDGDLGEDDALEDLDF